MFAFRSIPDGRRILKEHLFDSTPVNTNNKAWMSSPELGCHTFKTVKRKQLFRTVVHTAGGTQSLRRWLTVNLTTLKTRLCFVYVKTDALHDIRVTIRIPFPFKPGRRGTTLISKVLIENVQHKTKFEFSLTLFLKRYGIIVSITKIL